MAVTHTYRYPYLKRYVTKSGEVRYCSSYSKAVYRCKLHHPDDAEMALILEELAAGATRAAVAEKYRVGTPQRLKRLLAKFAAKTAAAPAPAPAAPPPLADAALDAVLADAGWGAPPPPPLADDELVAALADCGL